MELNAQQQDAMANALESMVSGHNTVTERLESVLESIWNDANLVNPKDAYLGPDGEPWIPVGMATAHDDQSVIYRHEADLDRIRSLCRYFSDENEFAGNVHKNRINYIVGWGHTYNVVPKEGEDVSPEELAPVKQALLEFLRVNRWSPNYVASSRRASGRSGWGYRQQSNVFRRDRDGEVLLRKFYGDDGCLRVRYIEPERLVPKVTNKHTRFGIETDPQDEETVIAYHVMGESVDASEIQQRTRNGSSRHPRGIPINYAVRKNLVRAGKILRNGSSVTEVQTAIGLIRKHAQATKTAVQAFQSAITQPRNQSDDPPRRQKYEPGTILDSSQGIEYEFPGMKIDPSKYVASLQAELRAIASRHVMPEFMLSSDASNANFASTMVAEGPAVKNFEQLQWDEIASDLEIIWDALEHAAQSGKFDPLLLDAVDIIAEPPSAQARNRLEDAQVGQILNGLGWLSPQTGAAQFGLDYEQEQSNIERDSEQQGTPLSPDRPDLPPVPEPPSFGEA